MTTDGSRSTRDLLIDAVLDVVADRGLAAATVEAVAAASGFSRQTVYRYFGTREGMLQATILREEASFLANVIDATKDATDLESLIYVGLCSAVDAAGQHPFLRRVIEQEPAEIIPMIGRGRGPVFQAAQPILADLVRPFVSSEADVARIAEVGTRLLISFVLDPGDQPQQVARDITDVITHGITSAVPKSHVASSS